MREDYLAQRSYSRLRSEPRYFASLGRGFRYRKYAHYFTTADETRLVNVYSAEFKKTHPNRFGMLFSEKGDYSLNLAKEACSLNKARVLAALNCNFGFVVTDDKCLPPHVGYNLCIEKGIIKQLPIADKTACLLTQNNCPSFAFLRAKGLLTASGVRITWNGSLSKSPDVNPDVVTVFNSFNIRLLQQTNPRTGTIKLVDDLTLRPPLKKDHLFVQIDAEKDNFITSAAPSYRAPSLLESRLVLQIPKRLASLFCKGTTLQDITLDGISLSNIHYASTVGALLTQDAFDTLHNIEQSQLFRTTTTTGNTVYGGSERFARACLIDTPNLFVFFLVDARSKLPLQSGVTIDELRELIHSKYPDFTAAVNVDGGNAPKLIVYKHREFHVYGNLHYQLWPKPGRDKFTWDGLRGRKVPGMIYCFQEPP